MSIRFGTSGWRALIADEFTFPHLRVVVQSIADYIRQEGMHNRPMIVGYDTRFLSDKFADTTAHVLAANGLAVHVCDRDTPTPVIAFEVLRQKAAGGINITASHNPAEYSGLKFNSAWGGPALPETTQRIEAGCEAYFSGGSQPKTGREAVGLKKRLIAPFNPLPNYFKHLDHLVDSSIIKRGKIKVVVDALWGTGRGILNEYLKKCGAQVTALHQNHDVFFGGVGPTPEGVALNELRQTLKETKAQVGLATDGDADRFGIMDVDGTLLQPNEFLPLLLDHLVKTRKWKGVVARSVMTSHFLDAVAKRHGMELRETPVGFKYIGDIMVHENSVYPARGGNFVMGGEESGGITIRGHVPEKDGILACLLAAEIVALTKKPLRKTVEDLQKEVGVFASARINFHTTQEKMQDLKEKLRHKPPTKFGALAVRRIVDTDGFKFIFSDNSWLGVRLSGTEPVVRLYLEADNPAKLKVLEKAGRSLAGL